MDKALSLSKLFLLTVSGYLFQNYGLLDNENVSTNLDLGLVNRKCNYIEKDKLKKDVLARVGLTHIHLEQKHFELSGGEAQRVALAKIILKNPPLILADELTASLVLITSQGIMKLLLDLKNENRLIIIATHNPDIWNQADEVINLNPL
ncbi:Methionine ABC transporter ATP-binding protein [Streptococcus infantis]|uniref:Methionine ABC transporter ATP-binding protein n=1 Tax=Streptococcus infantis TaxID=68892 RepID=A0A139REQ6_9STRE|nr:Methionine ABC transporter ATP-binding protein [Streptococcus infantis]